MIGSMVLLFGSLAVTASIDNFREMVEPDLAIIVIGNMTLEPTDEIRPLSDHYIDLFTVNLSILNKKENFDINIPRFFACTLNGTSLWCIGMYPVIDAVIPAGGSIEIGIFFQVPKGEMIGHLEYFKPSGEVITLSIPGRS
jgi:hypothetical protein